MRGRTCSHAAPHDHLLPECLPPAHHRLPEPVRVLLFPDTGAGGMHHGAGRGGEDPAERGGARVHRGALHLRRAAGRGTGLFRTPRPDRLQRSSITARRCAGKGSNTASFPTRTPGILTYEEMERLRAGEREHGADARDHGRDPGPRNISREIDRRSGSR